MPSHTLEVLHPGAVTSVGFGCENFVGAWMVPTLRDELTSVIEEQHPKILQFDLTGIRLLTSDVLNLLVSVHNHGVEIVLFNPSEDVRAVLEITKLDSLFAVVEADE